MQDDIKKLENTAEMLKVLAHPVRLCIIKGLIEKGQCNVGHMQSCLSVPQSTVSQHLQKLKSAGIVECKRNGLEINYKISNSMVVAIIKALFEN